MPNTYLAIPLPLPPLLISLALFITQVKKTVNGLPSLEHIYANAISCTESKRNNFYEDNQNCDLYPLQILMPFKWTTASFVPSNLSFFWQTVSSLFTLNLNPLEILIVCMCAHIRTGLGLVRRKHELQNYHTFTLFSISDLI